MMSLERLEISCEEARVSLEASLLEGHACHPAIPRLQFTCRETWMRTVMNEILKSGESGLSPFEEMLNTCMRRVIDNGAPGVAPGSPTYLGDCPRCRRESTPMVTSIDDTDLCPICSEVRNEYNYAM